MTTRWCPLAWARTNTPSWLSSITPVRAIGDLAGLLVMDRSTLGHLLRPLEKRRVVRLGVSDQDGRSRIADLTPAGRALVASAHPLWARAQQRFADAVGEDDAIELRTVLKRVANADF